MSYLALFTRLFAQLILIFKKNCVYLSKNSQKCFLLTIKITHTHSLKILKFFQTDAQTLASIGGHSLIRLDKFDRLFSSSLIFSLIVKFDRVRGFLSATVHSFNLAAHSSNGFSGAL
jgi:hypothetical protein